MSLSNNSTPSQSVEIVDPEGSCKKDKHESIYGIFDNYKQIENKYKLSYKDMANIWYFMENHMAREEKIFQKEVRKMEASQ